jgi:hypothetical protein
MCSATSLDLHREQFFMDRDQFRGESGESHDDGYIRLKIDRQDDLAIIEKIWLPFTTTLNPNTRAIAQRTAGWALSHEFIRPDEMVLLDGLRRSRFEVLAGLTCPDATELEFEIISNLYIALFFFDDLLDDERSVMGRDHGLASHIVEYLCKSVADEPLPRLEAAFFGRDRVVALGSIFLDVTRRLMTRVSRESASSYIDAMCDYFWGCVAEILARDHQIESVEEYANVRLRCSAVYPAVEIGVLVRGFTASPHIRDDRAFAVMLRNANLCVSYVNDIFSYEKEARAGESTNLVAVLRHIKDLDLPEAMAAAVKTVENVVDEYLAARQAFLRNHPDSKIARLYARQMETWMRGNLDWYNYGLTDRYVEFLTTARPA